VPDAVVEVIRDAVQRSFQLTVKVDRTLVSPDTTTASSVSHVAMSVISSLIFVTSTHTHPFNSPFSGTTRVCRYQKGKTNLDFTEARDSEWKWHQLGRMQVCTSLQTDNHASTITTLLLALNQKPELLVFVLRKRE